MRAHRIAPWELRVGHVRVYYDVDDEAHEVTIVAAGVKEHNCVRIGTEEVEL